MGKNKKMTSRALKHRELRKENNKAVKKTRERKKVQHEQTLTQIKIMKAENEGLELRIQNLRKQMESLKEIYYQQQRAGSNEKMPKQAENPIIKTESLDTEEDGDDGCQIDVEKYDHLRQILNEVHILNNS